MVIQQNNTSPKIILGGYGLKESDCIEFDLTPYANLIRAVYQFGDDGTSVYSFVSSNSFLNNFDKLECGKVYYIVLNPGYGSIEIPNLTTFTYQDSGISFAEKEQETTPTQKEKEGYYYYSQSKSFKYRIVQGESYDSSYYMDDLHKTFDTWEAIAKCPNTSIVHEVLIYFTDFVKSFGNEYVDVLAMASPIKFNKSEANWEFGNTFPTLSEVYINTSNIDYMKNTLTSKGDNLYFPTLMHEVAHTLALNYYSMNKFKNTPVASYTDKIDGKTKFYYHGDNALREYKKYFNDYAGLIGIPLDDDIEAPRIAAHWEEGEGVPRYINNVYHPALTNAMMTPFADEGGTPLTKIMIGFLEDYGYIVDYTKAEI